jgi:hypothetical protein
MNTPNPRYVQTPTNAEFCKDKTFAAACERAGIPATIRQASKYRNKKGAAYRSGRK